MDPVTIIPAPMFDLDAPAPPPPGKIEYIFVGRAAIPDPPALEGANPLPVYDRTDAALYGAATVPDGASTLWTLCYHVQGNTTTLHVFKWPVGGALTGPFDFPPPPYPNPLKFDWSGVTVGKHPVTGEAALIVPVTAHEAVSTSGRHSVLYLLVITGLGITPYADGHAPQGAAVNPALFGEGAPPPPVPEPSGLTTEDVKQAVIAALVQVLGAPSAGQIFNRLRDAATRGIEQTNLHDGNPAAASLYTRLDDILYEYGLRKTTADPDTHEHTNADEEAGR